MHRKNRASLKRMGLLALALVIALGALGVSYTIWSEDLYINSMVYTGSLDVDISGVSSVDLAGVRERLSTDWFGNGLRGNQSGTPFIALTAIRLHDHNSRRKYVTPNSPRG